MNILISNLKSGGAERVVSNLANELCKSTDVYVFMLSNEIFYELDSRVKVEVLGNSKFKLINIFLSFSKLAFRIYRGQVDQLQSHMFYSNYISGLLKILFPSLNVSMVHCVAWDSKFKPYSFKRAIHAFFIKLLYRNDVSHVFKSEGMQKSYFKIIRPTSAVVINNPVDFSMIPVRKNIPFHRVNGMTIVCVGRFHSSKRQQDLLIALSQVQFPFSVIFAGEGNLKESVMNKAQELGLYSCVSFVGNVTDPFKLYSNADLYVSCSESEGYPNALVEALCSGCAAIHADCVSGPEEILEKDAIMYEYDFYNAKYGLLYPVGDVNALSQALKFTNENRSLMRSKARGFSKDKKAKCVKDVSKMYKESILNE